MSARYARKAFTHAAAFYRYSVDVTSRITKDGQLRSSTAGAAYRAGQLIEDEGSLKREAETHDYARRTGVLHSEIMAPDHAPDWVHDRQRLWNEVEKREDQSNHWKKAQLYREAIISLPSDLPQEFWVEALKTHIHEQFVSKGMVADFSIHAPHPQSHDLNYHVHVMLTMRDITHEGFGNKNRSWNENGRWQEKGQEQAPQQNLVMKWRQDWADTVNRIFEREGLPYYLDPRSLKDRGMERTPEPKQGPLATQIEREGRDSHAGNDRRAVQIENEKLAQLYREADVIDLEIERLKRSLQKDGLTLDPEFQAHTEAIRGQKPPLLERHQQHMTGLTQRHAQEMNGLKAVQWRQMQAIEDDQTHDRKAKFRHLFREQKEQIAKLQKDQARFWKLTLRAIDPTGLTKTLADQRLLAIQTQHERERVELAREAAQRRDEVKAATVVTHRQQLDDLKDRQLWEKIHQTREHQDRLRALEAEAKERDVAQVKEQLEQSNREWEAKFLADRQALTREKESQIQQYENQRQEMDRLQNNERQSLKTKHWEERERIKQNNTAEKKRELDQLRWEQKQKTKALKRQLDRPPLAERFKQVFTDPQIIAQRKFNALQDLQARFIADQQTLKNAMAEERNAAIDTLKANHKKDYTQLNRRQAREKTLHTEGHKDKIADLNQRLERLEEQRREAQRIVEQQAEQDRERQKMRDDFGRSRSDDRRFRPR